MKFFVKGYSGKQQIKFLPVIIIILIIIPCSLTFVYQTFNDLSSITDINVWSIDEQSTIDTNILWQRSVPCLNRGLGNPNGVVALSQGQLILPCRQSLTGDVVIAYDLLSGEELWEESAQNIDEIRPITDSYIIVFNDSDVKRLNYSGDVIWQYEFTSRNIRTVIPCGNFICIPASNTGLRYIRSIETGANIQDVEMEYIFAIYPDFAVRNQTNQVEIIEQETQSSIWMTQVPYQLSYENFLRYEDILLMQYENNIQAFNISTGNPLWTIERISRSLPLLIDNHLFIYTPDNSLEIYDVTNGELSGRIILERLNTDELDEHIALSGNSNTLAITYLDTLEVIVLTVDLES